MSNDGTLCNHDHRLHFITGEGKKDWEAYNQACVYDIPDREVFHVVAMADLYDYEIILCSGCSEKYRKETERWLKSFCVKYSKLFMRPEGDYRPDDEIKEEILDKDILPHYDVRLAIDDRDRIVKLWRRRGIKCWQVREGNF